MSRYRPPRPKSSAYITPEGHAALQAELKELWKVTRPEVTRKVSEAAAMGDRSENAEYIYGKRQLREIDGRIRFLSKRLDALVVGFRDHKMQDDIDDPQTIQRNAILKEVETYEQSAGAA